MPVIRSAGLRGFRATVAELGGDAEDFVRRVNLPLAALDSDDLLVEDEAMATVLELAAADLACPDLGLRMASRQDLGMLGALALAIQNSPTLGDALACTVRYLFVHTESMRLGLEPDPYGTPGIVALGLGAAPGREFPPQAMDLSLGFIHRSITFLTGPYGLRTVELPHVPAAPLSAYEEFYGVPVRTGRPAALLRVPHTLESRPLTGGDTHLRDLAVAFLAEHTPGGSPDLPTRVRAAVRQSLGTSTPTVTTVADLLSLHPRTLQRRLAERHTTFAALLDEERRRAARRYLTATDLPFGQIAGLLALSEQSALNRCCRRWWGTTPKEARRHGLPAEADLTGRGCAERAASRPAPYGSRPAPTGTVRG
ncbi:AraC family transcriptional regulator ligand-binding domain-containing protein [Streptomyces sp. NPDC002992]|uniref:AraC family transcriptional regulator n=1 Tax=Streptomyces sp. NPDC002992 TaxID=3154273 RepID=UPI0033B88CA7